MRVDEGRRAIGQRVVDQALFAGCLDASVGDLAAVSDEGVALIERVDDGVGCAGIGQCSLCCGDHLGGFAGRRGAEGVVAAAGVELEAGDEGGLVVGLKAAALREVEEGEKQRLVVVGDAEVDGLRARAEPLHVAAELGGGVAGAGEKKVASSP